MSMTWLPPRAERTECQFQDFDILRLHAFSDFSADTHILAVAIGRLGRLRSLDLPLPLGVLHLNLDDEAFTALPASAVIFHRLAEEVLIVFRLIVLVGFVEVVFFHARHDSTLLPSLPSGILFQPEHLFFSTEG